MPLMSHYHDWTQTLGGFQCNQCSAQMPQPLMATYAPNDNNSQMADIGDDQSIWQQAWMQTTQTTT